MKTKEVQQELIDNMKQWMKMEDATIALTGNIIEKTDNPIIRLVMEIIQRDSQVHYRVQELIADSLASKTVALSTDELTEVWGLIEKHIELEQKTVDYAEQALEALRGKRMLVQEYLLEYLLTDESKHTKMLSAFENIKAKSYPYA